MSPKPLEEQVPYTELPTFLEKKKSKQTDLNDTTEWMLLPINDLPQFLQQLQSLLD